MAKDNNIVTRKDYFDVFTYLFTIDSSSEAMSDFNDFWKKHIKGKNMPFNNILILKIIINKYMDEHYLGNLTNHFIKFESLFIKLNPQNDKEIELFLSLSELLIKNIDEISIDNLIDFHNLFINKEYELNVLSYILGSSDLIKKFNYNTIIYKNIRKFYDDENEFLNIIIFINYQLVYDKTFINSLSIELYDKKESVDNVIYKLLGENIVDKKEILEKLKSLRDKYRYIEKKNNTLSNNIDNYNEKLENLTILLEEELSKLKEKENKSSDTSLEKEYMKLFTNYHPEIKKYHNKFDLVSRVLFMNNYVCVSVPKECGKKNMIDDFKYVFKDYDFIQMKYQDMILRLPEIYKVITEGGVLTIEVDDIVKKTDITNDHDLIKCEINEIINASQNLGNYTKFNNKLIKINPMFRLCIINHNNKEFNEYIKDNSLVNIECDYDEKLEEELTSKSMMAFFREYRKDLNRYGISLTTKDIVTPRNSYEMIEFFKEKDKLIKKDKNINNYYINLTKSYDPSNLLYSLFYEWQDTERRNLGILFMGEEHKKKLIKRMK